MQYSVYISTTEGKEPVKWLVYSNQNCLAFDEIDGSKAIRFSSKELALQAINITTDRLENNPIIIPHITHPPTPYCSSFGRNDIGEEYFIDGTTTHLLNDVMGIKRKRIADIAIEYFEKKNRYESEFEAKRFFCRTITAWKTWREAKILNVNTRWARGMLISGESFLNSQIRTDQIGPYF